MNTNVFAIIVTYNGERWIDKTLSQIYNSFYTPKVVVVDNASSDKTTTIIKEKYNDVHLIELEHNIGFGGANNIGIKHALENGCKSVLLLNQDAYVDKNMIHDLVEVIDQNRDIGVLSPIHLNGDGSDLDFAFKEYIRDSDPDLITNKPSLFQSKKLIYVSFVNAACWMVSRGCLEKVGGFNPVYPHYGEDNDYANRVAYFGYNLAIYTGTFVCHDRKQGHDFTNIQKLKIREYVSFLKHITNINLSLSRAILKISDKLIRETIYYSLKVQTNRLRGLLSGFILFIKNFSSAIKARSDSKQEGAYL